MRWLYVSSSQSPSFVTASWVASLRAPSCRSSSAAASYSRSASGSDVSAQAELLLQENRQIERAAETESVPAHARGIRQGHVGKALEQHGEQDGDNGSSRQVRA